MGQCSCRFSAAVRMKTVFGLLLLATVACLGADQHVDEKTMSPPYEAPLKKLVTQSLPRWGAITRPQPNVRMGPQSLGGMRPFPYDGIGPQSNGLNGPPSYDGMGPQPNGVNGPPPYDGMSPQPNGVNRLPPYDGMGPQLNGVNGPSPFDGMGPQPNGVNGPPPPLYEGMGPPPYNEMGPQPNGGMGEQPVGWVNMGPDGWIFVRPDGSFWSEKFGWQKSLQFFELCKLRNAGDYSAWDCELRSCYRLAPTFLCPNACQSGEAITYFDEHPLVLISGYPSTLLECPNPMEIPDWNKCIC